MIGVDAAQQEQVLGKAIANARRAAGLTQQELCAKADLSYSTLAKIERGAIKTPSVFTVAAIAAATGTTVEGLTGIETSLGLKAPYRDLKTSKTGIKFVYFDVNGVLVRYFQRAFTKIAEQYDLQAEQVEAIFWHYNDAACRGEIPTEQFNEIMAKKLNINDFSWANFYLDNVDPVKEAHDLLVWAAEHYRVGLMTNIMSGFVDAMTKRGLLPDINYDVIIDSSKEGSIKPEAKIYDVAVARAGNSPDEILLIDDDRTNLMAAEHKGWRVLWYDDYNPIESNDRVKKLLEY